MDSKNKWKPDYSAFIRPDLAEIIYEHAKNPETSLDHFKKIWGSPDLKAIQGMILINTGYNHTKYGEILADKILLLSEEYKELLNKDPLFEFFDGEIEVSFKSLVKSVETDPYIIYLQSKGDPSAFMEPKTLVHRAIHDSLQSLSLLTPEEIDYYFT